MTENQEVPEGTPEEANDGAGAPGPTRDEFVAWVEATIATIESVNQDQNMHWCPQWWRHPEAVDRFRALHRHQLACLPSEDDPHGALSSWWVDHWDRHAVVLFSKSGPFGQCRSGHENQPQLAVKSPPDDWEL